MQDDQSLEEINYTLSTKGWNLFVEEVRDELLVLKDSFLYVEDNNKLHFMRGKVSVLEGILNYRDKVDNIIKGTEDNADF